ncbi:magnesium transporter, partial [Pavlovales sp. CCMP2436]
FWLGVAASLIGDVVLNFGINLQRFAHIKLEKLPIGERVHYTRHPIWIGGFIIFLVGNLGDAVGLSFTPQSVITPIGSVSLVSNLLFARVLLKEQINISTLVGVFLIVGGVVTIVTTSNTACTVETLDTLLARWRRTDFVIFTVCQIVVLACLNAYVYRVERRMKLESEGTTKCLLDWQGRRLRVAYPILASMYATWTVLLIKSIGELIKETFRGNNQLLRWETYMLLIGVIISAPSQLRYLNAGLRHFEALFIVPVFYVFWIFGSITVGGIYFDEFMGFKQWQYGVFAAGVV